MLPKVSIIIPIYNSEKYIEKCIESAINQSYRNIEVVIVDDGSIDNSYKVVESYLNNDTRISYYKKVNGGPSSARNFGINNCKGSFITFLDADDFINEKYIESLLKVMLEENLDIVACGYIDVSKFGIIKLNDFYFGNSKLEKNQFVRNIFNGVGGTLWGKIFRKDIIDRNNIRLDTNVFMCEDMLFVLEYSMECKSFGAINEYLYNYNRLNENSISSKVNFDYYSNLIFVALKIKEILEDNNFDKEYIDKVMSNRIKNLIINFSIMQHDKKHKYSKDDKIKNLKQMFSNKLFREYKDKFNIRSKREKVLIYFAVKEKLFIINSISYLLFIIQTIKGLIRNNKFFRRI